MRINKWLKYIIYALIIAGIIISYPYLKNISVENILDMSSGSIIIAAFIIISLFALKCIAWFIPNMVLSIACGFIFKNPVIAFSVASIGVILEMSIGYLMGRYMKGEKLDKLLEDHPKIAKIITICDNKQDELCFLTRTLPVVPSDVASIFLGFKKMNFLRYTVITYLGSIPGMIPCIVFGLLKEVSSGIFIVTCALYALFMLANIVYVFLKIIKRKKYA